LHTAAPAERGKRTAAQRISGILATLTIAGLTLAILAVIVPRFFGVQLRAVLTGSMAPVLPVGSMVVIVPADFAEIQIGDDITFVRDKNLTVVTHRVIQKNEANQSFTTQGLNNNSPDPPVSAKNVLGVVRYNVPIIGYALMWLDHWYGKVITVAGILLLWMLVFLLGQYAAKRKAQSGINKTIKE
jgi:signal peptidase